MSVNRREFLAAATAFAATTGMSVRDAMAQKGWRMRGKPTAAAPAGGPDGTTLVTFPNTDGSQPTLSASNLQFKGYIRLPTDADVKNGYSASLKPMANGDLHLLVGGGGAAAEVLTEVDITGLTPSTTISSAPQGTTVRAWGSFVQGYALVEAGYGRGKRRPGGLYYDPIPINGKHILWWNYGDAYAPQHENPSFGATILNDDDGTLQSYGPYKFGLAAANNKGRSGFFPIPQWFLDTYTAMGNKRIGVYGGQWSGNIAAPWGLSAFAFEPFDPRDVAALTTWNEAVRQDVVTLVHHDVNHRMTRNIRQKQCGFGDGQGADVDGDGAYLTSENVTLALGDGKWGGAANGTAENDTQRGVWFIDTADCTGVMHSGIQVCQPEDEPNEHDVDGYAHHGYAEDVNHGPTGADSTCPHGCFDQFWGTTGPWASYREGKWWATDPHQYGEVASATRNSYACTPSVIEEPFSNLHSDFHKPQSQEFGQLIGFDYATNRLFMWCQAGKAPYDRYTLSGVGHAVLAVFEVVAA